MGRGKKGYNQRGLFDLVVDENLAMINETIVGSLVRWIQVHASVAPTRPKLDPSTRKAALITHCLVSVALEPCADNI